jgi:chromosome segregation ATPase
MSPNDREWSEGSPYWKAEGSQPSDVERSTWGQGSWDAEMASRAFHHRREDHDIEDSVQLLIALTAGKAEKSARYIVEKYQYEARQAHHLRQRLEITARQAAAAVDEVYALRRDLAKLREELDRCQATLAGVEADNLTVRIERDRARDERDEARDALQCFERIVLNGGKAND